ncbi:MAG: hypothetical protein ACM3X6_06640 [Patescibacteria group bacterium]
MKAVVITLILAVLAFLAYNQFVHPVDLALLIGIEEPYANYGDFAMRGVPRGGFSLTGYTVTGNTITINCYTSGQPGDRRLIEPFIDRMRRLTVKLRDEYAILLFFFDGNPYLARDGGKMTGTGQVLRQVNLTSGL